MCNSRLHRTFTILYFPLTLHHWDNTGVTLVLTLVSFRAIKHLLSFFFLHITQLYRIVHIVYRRWVCTTYIYNTCTTLSMHARCFLKVLSIFLSLGWHLIGYFFVSVCWGQHLHRVCTNKFFSKTLILWWTWISLGIVLPLKRICFEGLLAELWCFEHTSAHYFAKIPSKPRILVNVPYWTCTCFGFGLLKLYNWLPLT